MKLDKTKLEERISEIKVLTLEQMLNFIQKNKFTNETFQYMNLILINKDYCGMLEIKHPYPAKEGYFKARILAHYFEDLHDTTLLNDLRSQMFNQNKKEYEVEKNGKKRKI